MIASEVKVLYIYINIFLYIYNKWRHSHNNKLCISMQFHDISSRWHHRL